MYIGKLKKWLTTEAQSFYFVNGAYCAINKKGFLCVLCASVVNSKQKKPVLSTG